MDQHHRQSPQRDKTMLDHDCQNNKIFFDRQNLAPYLVVIPSEHDAAAVVASNKKEDRGASAYRDEADAAAGGASVLQRVSSFSILPRSSSSIGLSGVGGNIGTATTSVASSAIDSHLRRTQPSIQPSTPTRSGRLAVDSSQMLAEGKPSAGIVPSWRLRDRMKTVGVGLVMVSFFLYSTLVRCLEVTRLTR